MRLATHLGSRAFGDRRVFRYLTQHPRFSMRHGKTTAALARFLGPIYLHLYGWPDQEVQAIAVKATNLLRPRPADRILIVGCGPGVYALELATRYRCTVTGIDTDSDDISLAQTVADLHHLANASFAVMDPADLCFPEESFDKVLCVCWLAHVQDDNLVIQNIARVLKRNGVLVGYVPIRVPMDERSHSNRDCAADLEPYGWNGQHRYSMAEIEELMARNGLQLMRWQYGWTWLERRLRTLQQMSNTYIVFPFTQPVLTVLNRFFNRGTAILFQAIK